VRNLELRSGSVTVRPELGADATFSLRDLDVGQARAYYGADSTAAALKLSAQLAAPGRRRSGSSWTSGSTAPRRPGPSASRRFA